MNNICINVGAENKIKKLELLVESNLNIPKFKFQRSSSSIEIGVCPHGPNAKSDCWKCITCEGCISITCKSCTDSDTPATSQQVYIFSIIEDLNHGQWFVLRRF